MAIFWAIAAAVLVAVVLYALPRKRNGKRKKLPPGPKGFPLFGTLHMLGELPHRDLQKLARKYGPIMHMRLGVTPTIIVSSPEAAELFLKTHDLIFASRPPSEAARHMSWGQRNLVFGTYGSYWRGMRKMCTFELFSSAKISTFKPMRSEEVGLFVESIREAACDCVAVDLSAKITALSADMTCRMVFGKKYSNIEFDERGFKAIVEEALHLAAVPNLGDYIPFLAPFDLQGFTKRMKELSKVFDTFFEKIIDEHVRSKDDDRNKDFVDLMLSFMESKESEYPIEKPNIKALMLDMLAASMDTTATAIEWTITELIKHPRALHKVQKELEIVVGMSRMVEESDLEKLIYLDTVVKETFRLHPVAPLLIPHAALEDCVVDGFDIPGKARVLVNVWAIGRDPNTWSDPEEFLPERFEGSSIDVRGRDFQLIPFGSGRRGCPGMQLGLTTLCLVVAQLMHCFHWELPNGMSPSELDTDEVFGLTTPRKNHLRAIPTYRLQGTVI